MFKFGATSQRRLESCHPDLQLIMTEAIKYSSVDWGIAEGQRSYEDQLRYFLEGKSKLDPRDPGNLAKAKHLKQPAMAVDIYVYNPDDKSMTYDVHTLCMIAGTILATAYRLHKEDKITHKIRWGGNFNNSQIIMKDDTFIDLPHFELT